MAGYDASALVRATKRNAPTIAATMAPAPPPPAPAPQAVAPPPPPAAPAAPPPPIKSEKVTLDRTGVAKEFDSVRNKASQREGAQLQAQKDALARRAAQLGGGVSGALIKQESVAADASAQRVGEANEAIDAAQSQELRRIGEQETTMNFQREELDKQLTSQRDSQIRQIEAAAAEGKLNREQAAKQLEEVSKQFEAEFAENKKTNYINTIISAHNSGIPPDRVGQLLSELGIGFNGDGTVRMGGVPGLTAAAPPPPAPTRTWISNGIQYGIIEGKTVALGRAKDENGNNQPMIRGGR